MARERDKLEGLTSTERKAEQADALVDICYYALNAASKLGMDLDPVFSEVHAANMRKQIDGKFKRDYSGKVIKPDGWKPPDVLKEIQRQEQPRSYTPQVWAAQVSEDDVELPPPGKPTPRVAQCLWSLGLISPLPAAGLRQKVNWDEITLLNVNLSRSYHAS